MDNDMGLSQLEADKLAAAAAVATSAGQVAPAASFTPDADALVAAVVETREEKIARLRARAAALVDETFDEEAMLAQFVAEEKVRRTKDLRAAAGGDEPGGREGTGSATHQGFPRKYVRMMIYKGNQAHDLAYVPVSINGYAWKITRGVDVLVPSVVAETLEHAIEELTIQGEGGLITRPSHRFPFQVKGEVTEEAYLAFAAEQRDLNTKAAVQKV